MTTEDYQVGTPFEVTALFDSPLLERFEFALIDPEGQTRDGSSAPGEPLNDEPAVESKHLLGSWAFDEVDGEGVVIDTSPAGNEGTLRFGPTPAPGISGSGILFDGFDDYIDLGQALGPSGGSPRTVTVWARTESPDPQYILTYGGSAGEAGSTFRVGLNTGCEGVTLDISDGMVTYQAEVADGRWHNYAFVVPQAYEPKLSEVLVYQDGQLLESVCRSQKPEQKIVTECQWRRRNPHFRRS